LKRLRWYHEELKKIRIPWMRKVSSKTTKFYYSHKREFANVWKMLKKTRI